MRVIPFYWIRAFEACDMALVFRLNPHLINFRMPWLMKAVNST